MIYQTVSYAKDNKNPTDEDILKATENALKVPMTQKFHMRIWFPHRAGLTDQVWDWLSTDTHFNMNTESMKRCGHIAIWVMVPESAEVHEASRDGMDQPLPDSCFMNDNGECDWWGQEAELTRKKNHVHLDYYPFISFQAYEYARSMREMNYDVGFAGCIHAKPKSFNKKFGAHFDGKVVIPVVMVYAGTDGEIIQHTPTRDEIDREKIAGEFVGLDNFKMAPFHRLSENNAITNMPHLRKVNGDWVPMSKEEVISSGVSKRDLQTIVTVD